MWLFIQLLPSLYHHHHHHHHHHLRVLAKLSYVINIKSLWNMKPRGQANGWQRFGGTTYLNLPFLSSWWKRQFFRNLDPYLSNYTSSRISIQKCLTFTAVRTWPLIFVAHFLVPFLSSTFPSLVHIPQIIVLSETTCASFSSGQHQTLNSIPQTLVIQTADMKQWVMENLCSYRLQAGEGGHIILWHHVQTVCGHGTQRNISPRPDMKLTTFQKLMIVPSGLHCQFFTFSYVSERTALLSRYSTPP